MYNSPIDFILNNEEIKKKGNIITEFRQYDVIVKDLEELAKALKYDREQYNAGYKDGYADAMKDIGREQE